LHQYFEEIASSGESLLSIINDLLDLSKLQSGKMLLMLKLASLVDVVHKVCAELSLLATERQIAMMVNCIGKPRSLVFDASRMIQLMRNLLANALRYSPDNGTIEIRIDFRRDDVAHIHVLDEGCGIPAGEEEAIFEPFVQSGARFGASNTGLGLPICRQIIEQGHQGRISAMNRTGGGAEFTVALPTDLQPTLPESQGGVD